MPEITKEQVVDFLSKMSVMDLAGLTKELEDKWGVKAAAVAVAAGPAAGAAAAAPAAEEKTEFEIVLTAAGAQKIQVIKVIGLKEAKELVDGAPKTVKEGASKQEAEEIKKKITEAGGSVEVK
jgi:large subunit ribosomal protein L7/L12